MLPWSACIVHQALVITAGRLQCELITTSRRAAALEAETLGHTTPGGPSCSNRGCAT